MLISSRALGSIWTRIGIWRSLKLNLAKLASLSPIVPREAVRAIACTVTPKSAARCGSGTMTISGFTKLADEDTSTNPGIVRICFSTASAA